MKPSLIKGCVAVTVSALVLLGACGPSPEGDGDRWSGLVLPRPLAKPDLSFTNQYGQPYDLGVETRGVVTLLFFGYTHCPDVCPLQMAKIAAALGDLPPQTARSVRVVFVTTDPERDTAERLRTWLSSIHPDFVGLRGPLEEVHTAEASLMLPASTIDLPHGEHEMGGTEYLVGHASWVVAFAADGLSRLMFRMETSREDYARDLMSLVEEGLM